MHFLEPIPQFKLFSRLPYRPWIFCAKCLRAVSAGLALWRAHSPGRTRMSGCSAQQRSVPARSGEALLCPRHWGCRASVPPASGSPARRTRRATFMSTTPASVSQGAVYLLQGWLQPSAPAARCKRRPSLADGMADIIGLQRSQLLRHPSFPAAVLAHHADCDTCRWMAPDTFSRVGDQSAVTAQPQTPEQRMAAMQALISCPT